MIQSTPILTKREVLHLPAVNAIKPNAIPVPFQFSEQYRHLRPVYHRKKGVECNVPTGYKRQFPPEKGVSYPKNQRERERRGGRQPEKKGLARYLSDLS